MASSSQTLELKPNRRQQNQRRRDWRQPAITAYVLMVYCIFTIAFFPSFLIAFASAPLKPDDAYDILGMAAAWKDAPLLSLLTNLGVAASVFLLVPGFIAVTYAMVRKRKIRWLCVALSVLQPLAYCLQLKQPPQRLYVDFLDNWPRILEYYHLALNGVAKSGEYWQAAGLIAMVQTALTWSLLWILPLLWETVGLMLVSLRPARKA